MSTNVAEKGVSKVMGVVTGLVLTAIPVVVGIVVYNLTLRDTVSKLHDKIYKKA